MASQSMSAAPARVPALIVFLMFLAVVFDGFDTGILSFVIPILAREWGIGAAAFTAPIVLTNIGVVVGYMASGTLGAHYGRRHVLFAGLVVFGVATILSGTVLETHSVGLFAAVRFLCGLGLGAVLPVAVSIGTDLSPGKQREVIAILVTLGLATGLTIAGLLGGKLLLSVGPEGAFLIGGVLPLLLVPVAMICVPEPPAPAALGGSGGAVKVSGLFAPAERRYTVLIWLYSLLVFISSYILLSWIPTLLVKGGVAPTKAPLGLAALSLGGIVGGLLLSYITSRIGIKRALMIFTTIGWIGVAAVSQMNLSVDLSMILLVLGVAGLGIVGSQISQLALAVSIYPIELRTLGVGWAAALGRIGSIVGPAVAGLLLAMSMSSRTIIFTAAIPVFAGFVISVIIWRLTRHDPALAVSDRKP